MRFKQICNHPSQWLGDGAWAEADSGKFGRLREIAEVIAARAGEGARLHAVPRDDGAAGRASSDGLRPAGLVLHGETAVKQRQELVRRFQEDEALPFFVLSLKAGGTGLNLTAASHVVHFDRWWNPAVENQATDRAFRIGQTKNVLVHKFVCRGTVEEQIDEMIESKRQLAQRPAGGRRRDAADRDERRRAAEARGPRPPRRCPGRMTACSTTGGPTSPSAERRHHAAARGGPLAEEGPGHLARSLIDGRNIAKTFWGKAWCDNLERYSDFANRLPRGRTYVRNGSVIDLQIARGRREGAGERLRHLHGRRSRSLPCPRRDGAPSARLRGRDRLPGRAAPGALLARGDGPPLPGEDRPVSFTRRAGLRVQLPRLGLDVQARRGRALRRRRPARRAAGDAVRAARHRREGSDRARRLGDVHRRQGPGARADPRREPALRHLRNRAGRGRGAGCRWHWPTSEGEGFAGSRASLAPQGRGTAATS